MNGRTRSVDNCSELRGEEVKESLRAEQGRWMGVGSGEMVSTVMHSEFRVS